MKLYSFFRSSASYRARVALHLKGLSFETVGVHLAREEQHKPEYREVNPQGRVPALELKDGTVCGQSMAIIDYLEQIKPEPSLYPSDPILRARALSVALTIAADVHPIIGIMVTDYLKKNFAADEKAVSAWYAHWMTLGFESIEKMIDAPSFAFGDTPTVADICIAGQMLNARRFNVDASRFPKILKVEATAAKHPAFIAALPANQPDAE